MTTELGMSFWSSRVVLTAVEFGVFTELAKGPRSLQELIDHFGWHPRAAGTFLDALVGVGLLKRDREERYANTRALSIGLKTASEVRTLTAGAAVNLCLVRRANRDGHVMRSFEIPACGGFMIAEDTVEHRDVFGPEGECVLYFTGPRDAAEQARRALADPAARSLMARAAHQRIVGQGHTYRDRLRQMLSK